MIVIRHVYRNRELQTYRFEIPAQLRATGICPRCHSNCENLGVEHSQTLPVEFGVYGRVSRQCTPESNLGGTSQH